MGTPQRACSTHQHGTQPMCTLLGRISCRNSLPSARSSAKRDAPACPAVKEPTPGHSPACILHAPAWDFLQLEFVLPFHGAFCPHSVSPARSSAKRDAPAWPAVEQPQNACPSVRAPSTSVGSSMLLYKTEQQIFFVSHIQFLIPDAVAIPSSQTHQKLICTKTILHTHLPNIHAFLTTIHICLINFSLLTLPQMPNSPF